MHFEYTERQMYNQLLYYAGLWDVDKAKAAVEKDGGDVDKERILALAEHNRTRFGTVKAVVDGYLKKCGRQWVDMDTLFSFMV